MATAAVNAGGGGGCHDHQCLVPAIVINAGGCRDH